MSSPTTAEILEQLRTWLAVQAPGLVPSHVAIHCFGVPAPIQLPFAPAAAAFAEDVGPRGRAGLDPCVRDILSTLRGAGRPLTKTRLFEEMEARCRASQGGEYSPSTIERRLALLMEDETIENPKGAKPPGYRLAE